MARRRSEIVVSALLSCGALFVAAPARAACPGTFDGWSYATPIDFDNKSAAQTNHLALVTIDTSNLVEASKLKADGGDLRFADSSCNELDAWVDSGLGTASTKVWVKVASLPAGASTIYAFYGKANATRTNDPSRLFGGNLVALYTFTEGSGATLKDHVGTFDLALSGTVAWTSGFRTGTSALNGFAAGRAMRTDTMPALGSADFTAFSVVLPNTVDGSTHGIIGNYNDDNVPGWSLKLQGDDNRNGFMLLTSDEHGWCQQEYPGVESGVWSMLAGRRASGLHTGLINGVAQGTGCEDDVRDVSTGALGPWELGHAYDGGDAFDGNIAFTAIYSSARSDADLLALHDALGIGTNITSTAGAELGKPGAPTLTNVDVSGSEAQLTFTPPTTGNPTSYTATCNPGALTATGSASPLMVSGLTAGTPYSCTVHASNDLLGDGPESTPVSSEAGDLPGAPTKLTAQVNGKTATLSFVAPANDGGLAITSYSVSCQDGAVTETGPSSPIALENLVAGAYSCTVAAKNAKGVGPKSGAVSFTIGSSGPSTEPSSDPASTPSPDAAGGGADSGCSVPAFNARGSSTSGALMVLAGVLATLVRRRRSRADSNRA
ncbi:Fibronectin type III domain protein [Labilithrix luteola]|uniref:Fibronectin type III domain protein n=1 Tax=Labilithrix luteola TaxID=1391654 RepID=A0A0K1PTV1_9BACT|nr:DUF2341 domain-containing protein [Labilithrix luteola]AKU96559.1 Fibronectin type III domain protein [Labilithrix luteola]